METIFNSMINEEKAFNNSRAKIITIEGIDGAGKTSIVENCVKRLTDSGYKVEHFFTSSEFNCYWKNVDIALNEHFINSSINQMFHNIAFLTYLKTIFIDLVNSNDFVVSEWYIYGKLLLSHLYTGNENDNSKLIIEHDLLTKKIISPDYSFFVDVEPCVAYERIIKRNNRFESRENLEMLKQASFLWKKYYVHKYNMECLDGMNSVEENSKLILKKVLNREE